MKIYFLFTCCIAALSIKAQEGENYPASDSIALTGLVSKEVMLSAKDISMVHDTTFNVLKIVNHKGEFKSDYRQVHAVLLKKLLENKLLPTKKPKELNSFYFVCKAMDGYTAVYSYSEIFNPPADAVFIMTAYNNFNMSTMPGKPVILTLTGSATGKLGMRGVKSIDVRKAE